MQNTSHSLNQPLETVLLGNRQVADITYAIEPGEGTKSVCILSREIVYTIRKKIQEAGLVVIKIEEPRDALGDPSKHSQVMFQTAVAGAPVEHVEYIIKGFEDSGSLFLMTGIMFGGNAVVTATGEVQWISPSTEFCANLAEVLCQEHMNQSLLQVPREWQPTIL